MIRLTLTYWFLTFAEGFTRSTEITCRWLIMQAAARGTRPEVHEKAVSDYQMARKKWHDFLDTISMERLLKSQIPKRNA